MIGLAGLMGLTGLAYYAGYFSEGGRPNRSLERKQSKHTLFYFAPAPELKLLTFLD